MKFPDADDAAPPASPPAPPHPAPPGAAVAALLTHDEEADIDRFRDYLAGLPADALWDVVAHLDRDRFPRRHEAVQREIVRRGLFFVSPYTAAELRLRDIVGVCVALAVLAAALRAIGGVYIQLEPGVKLSWFYDLAVGGPKAARLVLPLARLLAAGGVIAAAVCAVLTGARLPRRRVRGDLAAMVAVGTLLALILTRLAFSPL